MNQQTIKNKLNEIVKNSSCFNQVSCEFLEYICDELKISREAIDPELNKEIIFKNKTNVLWQTGIKKGYILY